VKKTTVDILLRYRIRSCYSVDCVQLLLDFIKNISRLYQLPRFHVPILF